MKELDEQLILDFLRRKLRIFIGKNLKNLSSKDYWKRGDYEAVTEFLKSVLEDKLGEDFANVREISLTTVERFFQKYEHPYETRKSTLDKLCMCMGYEGYDHFASSFDTDILIEKAFNFKYTAEACKQIFDAYRIMPYLNGFSTVFDSRLSFEIEMQLWELSQTHRLVDGQFSEHFEKGNLQSRYEVLDNITLHGKTDEIWIQSVEEWTLFWYQEDDREYDCHNLRGVVNYQLVKRDEVWRINAMHSDSKNNVHPFLFK